ncbi:MAG: YicC family protein [Alphaproteobacteria bacterium]
MAICSMTAFARGQGNDPGPPAYAWTWEARSVNAKGLDVRLRLAPGFEALELAVRDLVTKRFKRGSISLSLSASRTGERAVMRLNEPLLDQLLDIAAAAQARLGERVAPPRLDGLLAVRGVLEPIEDVEDEAAVRAREARVLRTLDETMTALAAMREEEGARLAAVLGGQLDLIETLSTQAASTAALRPEAIRERLRTQVATLLEASPALSEERLAQEVALLAVKGDIREEVDRLLSHVAAARALLAEGGAAGRRLDFLCQEFNREANTLCAKSSNVDLTRLGLDLKATIDQVREQVQNIE